MCARRRVAPPAILVAALLVLGLGLPPFAAPAPAQAVEDYGGFQLPAPSDTLGGDRPSINSMAPETGAAPADPDAIPSGTGATAAAAATSTDISGPPEPTAAETDSTISQEPLAVDAIRIGRDVDQLVVDVILANLVNKDTADLLHNGVPVTVMVDIELWRERGIWFDSFETSSHLIFRIQRDIWEDVYEIATIESERRRVETFETLIEVAEIICNRENIPVGAFEMLDPDNQYYFLVTAALKPMTLEDVDKLESWISGEMREKKPRGFGLLGLPKQFFGVLLNLTGLHDQNDTLHTRAFDRFEAQGGIVLSRE